MRLNKIYFALGTLFAIAGFLLYSIFSSISKRNGQLPILRASGLGIEDLIEKEKKLDSDNDGLYDQEESFYRTNPYNPDTDGDGFLDGDEISAGCNPLDAENDCPISFSRFVNSQDQSQKDLENLTNLAAHLTAGAILSGDISRQTGDSETLKNNIETLADGFVDFGTKLFTIEEKIQFPVSEDNSSQATSDYIVQLSAIAEKVLTANPQFSQPLQALDPLSFTSSYVDGLKKIYDQELRIIVPSSWASNHQALIVITRKFITLFEALRQQNDDPLKAILAINEYPKLLQELRSTISNMLVKIDNQDLGLPTNNLLFLLSLTK